MPPAPKTCHPSLPPFSTSPLLNPSPRSSFLSPLPSLPHFTPPALLSAFSVLPSISLFTPPALSFPPSRPSFSIPLLPLLLLPSALLSPPPLLLPLHLSSLPPSPPLLPSLLSLSSPSHLPSSPTPSLLSPSSPPPLPNFLLLRSLLPLFPCSPISSPLHSPCPALSSTRFPLLLLPLPLSSLPPSPSPPLLSSLLSLPSSPSYFTFLARPFPLPSHPPRLLLVSPHPYFSPLLFSSSATPFPISLSSPSSPLSLPLRHPCPPLGFLRSLCFLCFLLSLPSTPVSPSLRPPLRSLCPSPLFFLFLFSPNRPRTLPATPSPLIPSDMFPSPSPVSFSASLPQTFSSSPTHPARSFPLLPYPIAPILSFISMTFPTFPAFPSTSLFFFPSLLPFPLAPHPSPHIPLFSSPPLFFFHFSSPVSLRPLPPFPLSLLFTFSLFSAFSSPHHTHPYSHDLPILPRILSSALFFLLSLSLLFLFHCPIFSF